MKKQIPHHLHAPSDIIETADDILLPYLRSLRDPSKIERAIVEGSEPLPEGTAFPDDPYEDQLFRLTQDIESYPKGVYRWNGTTWEFISTLDLESMDGQALLNQLIDGIFDGVDGLAKFADDFWQDAAGLGKFIDDFFSWDKIAGSITDFWGAVTDRANWLWGDILDTAANLFNAISDVANFDQWVTNFWGGVKSFTQLIGGAGATIADFFTALVNRTILLWGDISGAIADFWGAVTDRANWIWGDISGNIAAFWGAITDRANWAWGDISGNVAAFWSAITDRANWAWGDISGNIAAFWSAITDRANWLYSDISDTFANWKTSITDAISWIWSEITVTWQNICTTLASWANMLTGLGNFVWSNLTVTWQNILSTISSWANMLTGLGDFVWSLITVTWQNIMTTISSWANIISQVGGLTTVQVAGVLTSWATVTNVSALGNLAWTFISGNIAAFWGAVTDRTSWLWADVTHTAAQVMATIASWANIISQVGNLAWANLTKTWQNIMSTISSWTNILSQVGAMSSTQISTALNNWATVITGLGSLAWGYVSKTGAQIMSTISDWATIVGQTGSLAWGNLSKTAGNIMDTIASWANIIAKVGKVGPSEIDVDFIIGDIEIKTGAGVQWAAGGDPGVIITDLGLRGKGAAGAIMAEILASTGYITAAGGIVRLDDDGLNIVTDDGSQYLLFRKANETIKGAIYKDVNDYMVIHSTDGRIRMRGHTIPLGDGAFDLGLDAIRWGNIFGDDIYGAYHVDRSNLAGRPSPVVGVVGTFWCTREGSGQKEKLWICMQNDANTYEWVQAAITT